MADACSCPGDDRQVTTVGNCGRQYGVYTTVDNRGVVRLTQWSRQPRRRAYCRLWSYLLQQATLMSDKLWSVNKPGSFERYQQ